MPIPLGILAQSRQAAVVGDFVLLETQVLGSAASSITFSGLSAYAATYKHLQIRMAISSNVNSSIKFQFNGDTTGNYAVHVLEGNGSNVASFPELSVGAGYIGYSFAGVMGASVDLVDAFATNKFKMTRAWSGTTQSGNRVYLATSHWRSTNALSSVNVYNESGNFAIASRFSLYGVK